METRQTSDPYVVQLAEKNYDKEYSDESFWQKIAKLALSAGRQVVQHGLELYYTLQSPDCPKWAKSTIVGALGYFISPIDAIPDFVPFVGFSDDFGVIAAALAAVAVHITPEIRKQARERSDQIFGGQNNGEQEESK